MVLAKYQLICVGNAERMTTLSDPKAATVKTLASDAMDRESVIFPNSSRGEVNNQKRVNETRKEKRKKKKKRKKNKEEPKHMQEKVSGNPSRQLSTHSIADGGSNDDGRRSDDVSLAGPDESTDKEELNDQMVTTEAERPIVLEGRPGAQARDLESVDINRGGKVDDSINAKRGAIEMHTNYDSDIDLFSIASADSDVADSRCSIIDKKEYINPDEEITNAAAAKIDRTETIDLTKPTDLNNSVDGSFITADGRRSDDISLAGSDESTDKEELNDRKGSLRQRVVSDAETESNLQSGSIYSLIDI